MRRPHYLEPRIPATQDTRCDHNAFAHRVFPRVAFDDAERVLERLSASADSARDLLATIVDLTSSLIEPEEGRDLLFLKEISVTTSAIGENRLIVLRLTPPTQQIGAHLIGLLVAPLEGAAKLPRLRYFTLELVDDESTALCEWVTQEQGFLAHRNLRSGPPPSPASFQQAISDYLEFMPT